MGDRAPGPVGVSRESLNWRPYAADAKLASAVDETGRFALDTLGAGIVNAEAGHRWHTTNDADEVLFVVDGEGEISGGGLTVTATAGEFLFLPRGVELHYYFPVASTIVWVAHPPAAEPERQPLGESA